MDIKERLPHHSYNNHNIYADWRTERSFELNSDGLDLFSNLLGAGQAQLDAILAGLHSKQQAFINNYRSIDIGGGGGGNDTHFFYDFDHQDGYRTGIAMDFENFGATSCAKMKFCVPCFEPHESGYLKKSSLTFYVEDREGNRLSLSETCSLYDVAMSTLPKVKADAVSIEKTQKLIEANHDSIHAFKKQMKSMSPEAAAKAWAAIDKIMKASP